MAKNIKRYKRDFERDHPDEKEMIEKLGTLLMPKP